MLDYAQVLCGVRVKKKIISLAYRKILLSSNINQFNLVESWNSNYEIIVTFENRYKRQKNIYVAPNSFGIVCRLVLKGISFDRKKNPLI